MAENTPAIKIMNNVSLRYITENTPAMIKRRHSGIRREHPCCEKTRFLIAGVVSAIYPSSQQGCSLLYIRAAAFFTEGMFSAVYPSGGFLDSRGILCHISEWRRFFTAGVFSAVYPSGGIF